MATPNDQIMRGSAATLTLASIDSSAGNLGQQIFDTEYQISTVGRVVGVEIRINTDLQVFHEIGTRQAAQIVPGNINISGKVERAYLNGALVRMLLGRLGGAGENEDAFPLELQPTFNMILTLRDPRSGSATDGTRITLSGVQFDDWALRIPEDDFVLENATFRALRLEREELS